MANCPHCSVAIESLSGFVPQATLESRLKVKADENKLLTDELVTTRTKAAGFDAVALERDTLQGRLTGIEQKATRTEAMSAAGLDPALLSHVDILYQSAVSGLEEAPTLADWLAGDAKEHPLLADKFGVAGVVDDSAAAAANPFGAAKPNLNGAAKPNLNPGGPKGQEPAPPGGKISQADIQSYLSGPEYKGLSREDKKTKFAEVKAAWSAQESA